MTTIPSPLRVTISDFPARNSTLCAPDIVGLAVAAEAAGLDRFAVADFPYHRDCTTLMTACLAATRSLEVESLVTSPFHRAPEATACIWATMSELSGGRAVLGIGKGGVSTWVAPWGHDRPSGLNAVADLLDVCDAMWSGGAAPEHGRVLRTSGRRLEFAALAPKVLVAARGPQMLRLAARRADIVHVAAPYIERTHLRGALADVHAEAAVAGREPGQYEIDLTVSLSVLDDADAARSLGLRTTAAAVAWSAHDGVVPPGFPISARLAGELCERWDVWSGEPVPDDLALRLTEEAGDDFTIAGDVASCTAAVRRLLADVPGATGIRFKLPALHGDASVATYREMIGHAGAIAAALRTEDAR